MGCISRVQSLNWLSNLHLWILYQIHGKICVKWSPLFTLFSIHFIIMSWHPYQHIVHWSMCWVLIKCCSKCIIKGTLSWGIVSHSHHAAENPESPRMSDIKGIHSRYHYTSLAIGQTKQAIWESWSWHIGTMAFCNSCYGRHSYAVHPIQYAYGLVVLCFVVIMVDLGAMLLTHILQGYFTGTGAIVLPQCQWSNPEGFG